MPTARTVHLWPSSGRWGGLIRSCQPGAGRGPSLQPPQGSPSPVTRPQTARNSVHADRGPPGGWHWWSYLRSGLLAICERKLSGRAAPQLRGLALRNALAPAESGLSSRWDSHYPEQARQQLGRRALPGQPPSKEKAGQPWHSGDHKQDHRDANTAELERGQPCNAVALLGEIAQILAGRD